MSQVSSETITRVYSCKAGRNHCSHSVDPVQRLGATVLRTCFPKGNNKENDQNNGQLVQWTSWLLTLNPCYGTAVTDVGNNTERLNFHGHIWPPLILPKWRAFTRRLHRLSLFTWSALVLTFQLAHIHTSSSWLLKTQQLSAKVKWQCWQCRRYLTKFLTRSISDSSESCLVVKKL